MKLIWNSFHELSLDLQSCHFCFTRNATLLHINPRKLFTGQSESYSRKVEIKANKFTSQSDLSLNPGVLQVNLMAQEARWDFHTWAGPPASMWAWSPDTPARLSHAPRNTRLIRERNKVNLTSLRYMWGWDSSPYLGMSSGHVITNNVKNLEWIACPFISTL